MRDVLPVHDKYKVKEEVEGNEDRELDIVPRNDEINPYQQPGNWSTFKKWRVLLVACYVTLIVGINSTSITAAALELNARFNVADVTIPNSYWPVTAWNTGAAIAPMAFIPLMEQYGIKRGYICCYILFFLFVIPQAVAQNFATLIISRVFAGAFAGILQDIMDGIIADIWPTAEERSLPVTIYVFSLLLGVSVGPVFGGGIVRYLDWRWVFYIQLILYGVSFPFILLFFDETRPLDHSTCNTTPNSNADTSDTPVSSTHKGSKSTNTPTALKKALTTLSRPFHLLLTEPVVFFFTLLSALSYGLVFVSTQSVAQVFSSLYRWPEWKTGVVQTSLCLGECLGFIACLLQNSYYERCSRAVKTGSKNDSTLPEQRLPIAILGSILGLTGGLFIYAWTSTPTLPWPLPSLGLALLGFGVMATMQAIMIYITDAYGAYAGSASAAVCFGENTFAAYLPLAALEMYTNLGFAWASSLLGFVALGLSGAPVVLMWKGGWVRGRSRLMKLNMSVDDGGRTNL